MKSFTALLALLSCFVLSTMAAAPTKAPTKMPTRLPTRMPSERPTGVPTKAPTRFPTKVPTAWPSRVPTIEPSKSPTGLPTLDEPTLEPTSDPTEGLSVPTPPPSDLKGFLLASQQVDNVAYSAYLTDPDLYNRVFTSAIYTAAGVAESVLDLRVSSAGTSGESLTLQYSLVWRSEYWSYTDVSTILALFVQTGRFGAVLQVFAREQGAPALFPDATSQGVVTSDTTPPSAITFQPSKAPTPPPSASPTIAATALTGTMQVTQRVEGVSYAAYLADQTTYNNVFTAAIYASALVVDGVQNLQGSDAARRLTATHPIPRTNLRVTAVTTAADDAVELEYSLTWRQEYWSYAQVSTYLANFVQTGRFTALLQVFARELGHPALMPDAKSSSVVTRDTTVNL